MADPVVFPHLKLSGPVTIARLGELRTLLNDAAPHTRLDLAAVTEIDTAGAWILLHHEAAGMALEEINGTQISLLETVRQALPNATRTGGEARSPHRAGDGLEAIGKAMAALWGSTAQALDFTGVVIVRLGQGLFDPRRLRLTALVHHMQQTGVSALPIVALMGFLIGVVLAFQGAAQLRQFGAEIFVVDLIAVSVLRELGILLTAIIVAGRSASAFTAAIGSMKMREEIDAMRVLGLDPVEVLVLPRFLALVIVLPILGLVADLAGLFGGGLMAWIELGISPGQFRSQLLADVSATQALVGLSKAPVFAAIIALVGCHQGLLVKGDAESLGQRTSRAVVIAIFLVIVVDALFSVFFAVWGV